MSCLLLFWKHSKNQWLRWKIKFYYLSWLLQVKGKGVLWRPEDMLDCLELKLQAFVKFLLQFPVSELQFSGPCAFSPLNLSLNKLLFRTSWVLMTSFLDTALLFRGNWCTKNCDPKQIFSPLMFFFLISCHRNRKAKTHRVLVLECRIIVELPDQFWAAACKRLEI